MLLLRRKGLLLLEVVLRGVVLLGVVLVGVVLLLLIAVVLVGVVLVGVVLVDVVLLLLALRIWRWQAVAGTAGPWVSLRCKLRQRKSFAMEA